MRLLAIGFILGSALTGMLAGTGVGELLAHRPATAWLTLRLSLGGILGLVVGLALGLLAGPPRVSRRAAAGLAALALVSGLSWGWLYAFSPPMYGQVFFVLPMSLGLGGLLLLGLGGGAIEPQPAWRGWLLLAALVSMGLAIVVCVFHRHGPPVIVGLAGPLLLGATVFRARQPEGQAADAAAPAGE